MTEIEKEIVDLADEIIHEMDSIVPYTEHVRHVKKDSEAYNRLMILYGEQLYSSLYHYARALADIKNKFQPPTWENPITNALLLHQQQEEKLHE